MPKQNTALTVTCAREVPRALAANDEAVVMLRCVWLALQSGGAYLQEEENLDSVFSTVSLALERLNTVCAAIVRIQEEAGDA